MKTFAIPVVLHIYGEDEKHAIHNLDHDLKRLLNDADNAVTGFELLCIKEEPSC